ncbi:hypothetical protein TcasGA2_TC035034, partial [Tribolium castaneum]
CCQLKFNGTSQKFKWIKTYFKGELFCVLAVS